MKKIYSFIVMFVLVLSATAQTRLAGPWTPSVHVYSEPVIIHVDVSRAAGDTLMYMPSDEVFVNPTDSAGFAVVTEDVDGLTPNQSGDPLDFAVFYSTDTSNTQDNFYHPWENYTTDSAFFWMANSWFTPVGIANNWLMFGPITIPVNGAVIQWFEKCNPGYRDGYRVLATSSASLPVTNTDFVDPPFYTRTDAFPSPTEGTDTIWVLQSVAVPPAYNGMPIYFGYNHNANDMDQLYIDEVTVIEGPVGMADQEMNSNILSHITPNPASNFTTITYTLEESSNVSLDVVDVTGRVVMSINEGSKVSGVHNIQLDVRTLDAGVYFYTLNADGAKSGNRMVVAR